MVMSQNFAAPCPTPAVLPATAICGWMGVQHFARQKEFQDMTPEAKVHMLESRDCPRSYSGACSHMAHFMIEVRACMYPEHALECVRV